MSVDLKRGETLPIHINMSFPSLPCEGQLLIKFSRSLIISLLQVLIWALLNEVFHDFLFETMFHDFDTSFSGSCLFSIECGCNWHVWETWSWFAHKYLEGNFSVQNYVPSGVCSRVLIQCLHLLLPIYHCLWLVMKNRRSITYVGLIKGQVHILISQKPADNRLYWLIVFHMLM